MKTLKEIEKEYILKSLAICGHNVTKTARALGISLRCLRSKLNGYGLTKDKRQAPVVDRSGQRKKWAERVSIKCKWCGEKIDLRKNAHDKATAEGQINFFCSRDHYLKYKHIKAIDNYGLLD